MSWVKLGSSTQAELLALLQAPLKFTDVFEYAKPSADNKW